MLKRLTLLCIPALVLQSANAFAQSPYDFLSIFGGMVHQGMVQAASAEWQKVPPNELSCINDELRQQGASVDALASRGVFPSDPRLGGLRSDCVRASASASATSTPSPPPPSPYVVDGLALGSHVRFDSSAYKQYNCRQSDTFPGFTWCHKEKTEKIKHHDILLSDSILHTDDGTAWYINKYVEPAFFKPNEVQDEIDRLSSRFHEQPHILRLPSGKGLPDAVIAAWGKVELVPLGAADIAKIASGGSINSLSVSYLGDLQRSAKAGVPVYRLAGGAGFVWAATYNDDGRGVLRFLAIDNSNIQASPRISEASDEASFPATPSFNCSNASAADELAICSNSRLAQLDQAMALAYAKVSDDSKQDARDADRLFLAARRDCHADKLCIADQQVAAIERFDALGADVPVPSWVSAYRESLSSTTVPQVTHVESSAPVSPGAQSISVSLQNDGGTFTVPVLINNAITLNFTVDSGASDVSIPADVVLTLMRTGTIKDSDFIGQQTYTLADGSQVPSVNFRIRSLKVGTTTLRDVVGAVAPVQGSLLLGESFLSRFTSWSIDNSKEVLVLLPGDKTN